MSNDTGVAAPKENVGALLGDIAKDALKLVEQQFHMAKLEVSGEVEKSKSVAAYFFAGGAMMGIGVLLLLISLSYGLTELAPVLHPWASHLLVGLAAAGIGFSVWQLGMSKAESVHLLPSRTAHTIKEIG